MNNGRPRNLSKNEANLLKVLNRQRPPNVKRPARVKPRPSQKSLSVKDTGYGWFWGLLYGILTLSILVFLFSLAYHWLVRKEVDNAMANAAAANEAAKDAVAAKFAKAPQGILDMPTQEGAPVSTEGPPDDTENAYLTLYGSPDAPGFTTGSKYQRYDTPYQNKYIVAGGAVDSNLPYSPYPNGYGGRDPANFRWPRYNLRQPYTSDYYLDEEMRGIPRANLNAVIEQENDYIRDVNQRVRQINKSRMYSPQFLANKRELAAIRSLERRVANRVHREAENQPDLNPYY